MKLYLMRHGIAAQHLDGPILRDYQRPLTEEGKVETRQVALGLKKLGARPDVIVSSPLVRARQTAEILAEVFGTTDALQITDSLAPGGSTSEVWKFLGQFQKANEAFLVGHEPDMTLLMTTLLWAGHDMGVTFKKAAVCRIDISSLPPNAPGTLKWFISPKIACLLK